MKVFLIVIDSFGIGEMPDAYKFGDEGSNTYKNILNKTTLDLKNMVKLGLNRIEGVNLESPNGIIGSYARLEEKSFAKDTTAGHFEIAGIPLEKPYPVYPDGFSKELLNEFKEKTGYEFIGNTAESGTEIIKRLGGEHIRTGKPIIYTSQDSVLQIAAHEKVINLQELYRICGILRSIMSGINSVGRVIARPFEGEEGSFYRTQNRKDFSLAPPNGSMMDKLKENGFDVIAVGKIDDLFMGQGITKSFHTKDNPSGILKTVELSKEDFDGLCFVNLVDTDMLYGHRNDYEGYAKALEYFDGYIPNIIFNLGNNDILMITADHGCDPTTVSTDHSREYVPLLIFGKGLKKNVDFGTVLGFDIIAKSILDLFKVEENSDSLFRKL